MGEPSIFHITKIFFPKHFAICTNFMQCLLFEKSFVDTGIPWSCSKFLLDSEVMKIF